jgi:hypothetical protein
MEALLTRVADYPWTQSWQIALLTAVVALATWALRNRSAHVRYLLWLLVLAKCLTPPVCRVPCVLPDKVRQSARCSDHPRRKRGAANTMKKDCGPTPASAVQPPRAHAQQWLRSVACRRSVFAYVA